MPYQTINPYTEELAIALIIRGGGTCSVDRVLSEKTN